jgi:hypothetical protein
MLSLLKLLERIELLKLIFAHALEKEKKYHIGESADGRFCS